MAVVVLTCLVVPPAGAQDRSDSLLQIASVSPWVAPDGDFQVRFDPATSVPADARLTVTIHQPLEPTDEDSLRVAVQEVIDGGSAGRVLQAPVTVPLTDLGDPAAGAALTIPVRSTRGDRERVFLPNAGIHPVELVLTRPDGPEVWRQTVFLNRLPEPDEEAEDADGPGPVRVTLVLPVESGPAVGTEGAGMFGVEDQAQLGSAGSLLEAVPDAPLTLSVRPNTLDGLARTDEPWADALLDELSDTRRENVVLQLPYADVDSGGLVASDASGELERQIVIGAGTVASRIGRTPVASTWTGDETVTAGVLPVLAGSGVEAVLLPDDSLRLPNDVDEDRAMISPVRLEGGEGIRALAYDTVVSQRLADTGTDPAMRAHQSVAIMMASWFSAAEDATPPPLATAVLLSPTTEPAVIESLQSTLRSGGPLMADPQAGPLPSANPDDEEPVASLAPRTPPDLRGAVSSTNETRRQISAYRSMTGDADPDTALWDELTNESMASTIDAGERAQLHATVRGGIAAKVDLIEPPRARRVVVTSSDTVIPLRFRNDLPFEVRLVMRARSPRLEIDQPTTEIVLAPGENRIDLPVTVQAPGESLLRIELTSPDGGITIPGPDVPVRSTAISGVGAALSIVSILFLLGWWFRTMRRHRRERARDTGVHPSSEAPADQPAADRLGEGD